MNEEQKKQEEEQKQEIENVEEVAGTTEGLEEVVGETDGELQEEPVEEDSKPEDVQQSDENAAKEDEEPETDESGEDEPDEVKPEEKQEEEQKQEPAEEEKEEEEKKETDKEPSVEDLKKRIEEYETEKQERETLDQYTKLMNDVYADVQRFETIVQNGMIEGLKKFGIDPNLTFEEIKEQDPAKYELAVELVNQAQQRIDQHRQQAKDVLDGEGSKIVFDKAEREIKKYDLTPEQQVNAAEMFVNIMMRTGIQDLGEDLISKVKLAVGNAMIEVPRVQGDTEADKPDTTKTDGSDTTVSKEPTVVEEPEAKDKVEEKPANTPVQKVDLNDYKEGATDTSARADAVVNKDAVTADNVLQKLAALPYRERVAFMLEHEQEYNDAMSRRK